VIALAVAAVVLTAAVLLLRDPAPSSPAARLAQEERQEFATNDPVQRGCALGKKLLRRVYLGTYPGRSEDILYVPQYPNYQGTFNVPNHSGPWDYLQIVPLVLYGPGVIEAQGEPLDLPASVADVYATAGSLTRVQLPARRSDVLRDALVDGERPPKMIVTIVWDGVGRNVLERWPDRWPTLARMERDGTSYLRATVGSSPSITPATHSTLGTGAFPVEHGVTGITLRGRNGELREAFAKRRPFDLRLTTFADEIDRALANEPLVGMIAWRSWHMGMLGLGAALEGGDHDLLGIVSHNEFITGKDEFYRTPDFLKPYRGLDERMDELDRADGEADGLWMGHDIREMHDNPAWVSYLTDVILATWEAEGFGADDVPDLFFTNYKMSDIVGHQYTMDSEEMGVVLEAQDRALRRLVRWLDRNVGDYVVIVTSDHGHTPDPRRSGAWPIAKGKLADHINRELAGGDEVVAGITAVGIYVDEDVMDAHDLDHDDIARFVNDYTLAQNWGEEELPPGYEGRAEERLFSAAFPTASMDEVIECAFGDAAGDLALPRPPSP